MSLPIVNNASSISLLILNSTIAQLAMWGVTQEVHKVCVTVDNPNVPFPFHIICPFKFDSPSNLSLGNCRVSTSEPSSSQCFRRALGELENQPVGFQLGQLYGTTPAPSSHDLHFRCLFYHKHYQIHGWISLLATTTPCTQNSCILGTYRRPPLPLTPRIQH